MGRVQGARLMASGIPTPKWNNADITAGNVDLDALAAWYAARDLPWGIRVPVELAIHLGKPLFIKRCFGLESPAPHWAGVPGVEVRLAGRSDLGAYVDVDAGAFGEASSVSRRWVEPTLGRRGFDHWLALSGEQVVGVAEIVRTDDEAGPAAMLGGIGVRPGWEGRGVELLVAQRAIERALENEVELVHAHNADGSLCSALGFTEVPGFLIRVVRSA